MAEPATTTRRASAAGGSAAEPGASSGDANDPIRHLIITGRKGDMAEATVRRSPPATP